MNKFAVLDLEIIKTVEGVDDWFSVAPLGISCVAVALSDSDDTLVWYGQNQLGVTGSRAAIAGLISLVDEGYTLVGFNSLGFDFRVLATESGLFADCGYLALQHVDLFFYLFCALGYAPGLNRLAQGMGLPGKTVGMDGAKAPELWRQGQRQAVLDYCVQDVRTTLDLVQASINARGVTWVSKSGKRVGLSFAQWLTVQEAMALPEPDNTWMEKPWSRSKFIGWLA